ncbi:restriction endonuclease subunit S [Pseudodonghicola xiamenensis]|uniref:Type I restriction modification DNA specificity domain-containing protein n=1 Tax=Pseudodonghicola xiamenensis TaxID=337702 RepID=A0A8J3HC02_9RHOB|nr:restriction endonuclease subunit S [Pseudodonghicola xiamenensis]GHH00471.1 hypothetical protein GCM10010961_37240 [Pseudodonghicola xiamenensis]
MNDIARVPEGWSLVSLGQLMKFQNGFNTDKTAYGRGLRFANVLEVITNTHLSAQMIPGRVATSAAESARYLVQRGDVLFNRTSETQEEVGLASVYLDDEPILFGGFVLRGKPISDAIDPVFAGYGLRSKIVRQQIMAAGQGGIRANIGQKSLSQIKIALPDKPEQEAIAEALSGADSLIEGLERLIAKKRLIKQGAMQDLLTAKRRLPGFSGEWMPYKLGERGQFFKGSGVRKDEAKSGLLPCVRYGELYTLHHDVVRHFDSFISAGVAKTARSIKSGDILFAGSGETKEEIGKCAVVTFEGEMYAGGDIIAFRPSGDDPVFLSYLLNSPGAQKQKARKGQGDAVVHISATALGDLDLELPSQEEQAEIATVLEDMDAEIQALETRLEKARQVKEGMMQNLLTGRIRLV